MIPPGARTGYRPPQRAGPRLAAQLPFLVVAALLFCASSAATVTGCRAMAQMGAMPMAGGWTLSMAWMRMPGQTWSGAAAAFTGMWTVMTVAMMLPALMPMLLRHRQSIEAIGSRPGNRRTAEVAVAYFLVWAGLGAVVFGIGAAFSEVAMRIDAVARAVPIAAAAIVLAAGVLQFSAAKRHLLACCRGTTDSSDCDPRDAWRYGFRRGIECGACCAGLTAVLIVAGVMDLYAMALVTVAICAERFALDPAWIVRVIGGVLVIVGVAMGMHVVNAG